MASKNRRKEAQLCKYCGKSFKSLSGRNDHERAHGGKAPYKCCGKLFFSKANITRHRCSKHGQKKTYECEVCVKAYALRTDINDHMVHHKDARFKCNECELEINYRQQYEDHTSMHRGEKKHVCACGKSYTQKSNFIDIEKSARRNHKH